MHSGAGTAVTRKQRTVGCPIRSRTAHRLRAAPRPRFAVLRVLLRPQAPRHPPNTPTSLAIHPVPSHVGESGQAHVARSRLRSRPFSHSARFGKIEANSHDDSAPPTRSLIVRRQLAIVLFFSTPRYAVVHVHPARFPHMVGGGCAPRRHPDCQRPCRLVSGPCRRALKYITTLRQ